jgi:hypothetical protein
MGPTDLDAGKKTPDMSIDSGKVVSVGTLDDLLDNTVGGKRYFQKEGQLEKLRKYPIVAVINPGEGPDEQLLRITAVTWDHEYGVLRFEVGE